jgi:thiamine-phosphate pyrophosphorylase
VVALKNIPDCRLYGILDLGYVAASSAPAMVGRMIEGGVDVIQIRAKKSPEAEIFALAMRILPLTRKAGVPLLVNDFPALVPSLGAQGAHVGQEDATVAGARKLAGAGAIIGKSTHSIEQAIAAAGEKPDYIGFGPLFATATKPDYTPVGTDLIRRVHEVVRIPIFCIGGIKLENLASVLAAGARRVVIVSGILQAADVAGYCREARAMIENFNS